MRTSVSVWELLTIFMLLIRRLNGEDDEDDEDDEVDEVGIV
jgi:hypothetical protein